MGRECLCCVMFRGLLCAIAVATLSAYAQAREESPQGWPCAGPSPELHLRTSDIAAIRDAMKQRTRFRIIRIEPPDPKEDPPSRVIQVVTLTKGNCEFGEGARYWVRRGPHGWRILKKVGRDGWVTAA